MGWRYRVGLLFIGGVVFIWVAAAEVTQRIFRDYRHPFVLTWLGAALLAVYLPLAVLKDVIWACAIEWRQQRSHKVHEISKPEPISEATHDSLIKSPLHTGVDIRKSSELELHQIFRKDIDNDLDAEEGKFLLPIAADSLKRDPEQNGWEAAYIGCALAPLWFITEYLANSALARTSVASTTILSSTAGLFTLLFGTIFGQDSFNVPKAIAVFVSISGVVMTTMGKTWSRDDLENPDLEQVRHSVWGDVLGLFSAVSYGLFTILLKKYAGEEGSGIDVQRVFGYMGLFTLCALWWLVWPLSWIGWEPPLMMPRKLAIDEEILANGIFGCVLSDYFWALSVVWTTPLVATLGVSLTIPLAMTADMVVHGRHFSAVYILGSVQVFGGFVIANMTGQCFRKVGL